MGRLVLRGGAALTLLAYAFTTQGWQVYAFFLVGCLGAFAYPALNGILTRMVVASRQGALQGGLGAMNSVAAILGPLIAAQSLAWGSERGFDGMAFLIAGLLMLVSVEPSSRVMVVSRSSALLARTVMVVSGCACV